MKKWYKLFPINESDKVVLTCGLHEARLLKIPYFREENSSGEVTTIYRYKILFDEYPLLETDDFQEAIQFFHKIESEIKHLDMIIALNFEE